MDVYEKMFAKMYMLGFPDKYEGYNMVYDFKEYQADIKLYPTVYKIKKMWELLK